MIPKRHKHLCTICNEFTWVSHGGLELHKGLINNRFCSGSGHQVCTVGCDADPANYVKPKLRKVGMSDLRKVAKALYEVMKVMDFGREKHPADDWKEGFSTKDHEDAAFRHMLKYGKDEESGIDHRAHAIIRLLFALEKDIDSNGTRTDTGVGQSNPSTP